MDDLITQCAGGDANAWAAFVERYSGVIYAAVKRVAQAHGTPDATVSLEDMAQEVFVRLLKDDAKLLRAYDPERASPVTYLTIIARSAAIDRLRRQRPTGESLDPQTQRFQTDATPKAFDDTLEAIPDDLLTPRQTLVLQLLFDGEMEPAEAADLLGVSAQTIRSTQHKALERLRAHFRPKEGAP